MTANQIQDQPFCSPDDLFSEVKLDTAWEMTREDSGFYSISGGSLHESSDYPGTECRWDVADTSMPTSQPYSDCVAFSPNSDTSDWGNTMWWPSPPPAGELTPAENPSPTEQTGDGCSRTGPKAPKKYQCLYPMCTQPAFGRSADLERHLTKLHFPEAQKETYNCDYKKCQRSASTAFTRRDHFRDHLREFHKEDILKRGRGSRDQTEWLWERQVDARWWRCGKCLSRIKLNSDGWECPVCRQMCEPDRRKVREAKEASSK